MTIGTIFIMFFSFIGLILLFLFAKKLFYRFKYNKRFFIIPRISTLGISSVGMILALSVSVILLLIIATAGVASVVFRLWAGTRIIFEGILIKIGGLMFGPIIGMCLGAAVDILSIAYTGGIFHYGYFISAILFGLFGGVIRMLVTTSKSKNLRFCLFSSLFAILVIAFSSILIWISNKDDVNTTYDIAFFIFDFKITLMQIIMVVTFLPLGSILILWLCYFIYSYQKKKKPEMKDWFKSFAPVYVIIIVTEVIVNIIFMPIFDASVSPLNYQIWLTIRLLLFVPMVLLNIVIILPVYKIINPIVKYNYESELVQDLGPKHKKKPIHKQENAQNK